MKLLRKNTKAISLIFLCAITLFCPVQSAYAENTETFGETEEIFESGSWLYYDRGDYICVCGYTGSDAAITIPSEINGKAVKKVSAHKNFADLYGRKNKFFEISNKNTKEVTVSEGVTSIESYAFYGTGIEKVSLPKSLTNIGFESFCSCHALTSLEVPENVKTIGNGTFSYSGLEEIYLPKGLESIDEFAFAYSLLKRIYIPESVVHIGSFAFQGTDLEEITLPKGLTKVEMGVFIKCQQLKRVYISEGTQLLDEHIFYDCQNLEEVYLPSTLLESEIIFKYNDSLKNIYFAGDREHYKFFFGSDIMDTFYDSMEDEEDRTDFYKNVGITYNTPVPAAQPIPYPEHEFKLDNTTIFYMVITALSFIGAVVFLTAFIITKTAAKRKKESEEIKEKEEGFHPYVLGVWQCEKCGTSNGPIAEYCYNCGKRRQK